MPDQLQALHLEHTFLHVQHSNITLIEPQMMTPGFINGAPRDDGSDDNDGTGNGDPIDEPDNEGPDDLQDNPDNSKHGMENNLADAITALARNVQHCCEYTDIFPFFSLLSIVSITFLIYFRSIYLKHTS